MATFTVSVKVNAAAVNGTQILDTDNITSGTTDPISPNNSASMQTGVGATGTANIVVTKTASPNPVQPVTPLPTRSWSRTTDRPRPLNVKLNDTDPSGTTVNDFHPDRNRLVVPEPSPTAVQCTLASFASGGHHDLYLGG